MNDDNSARKPLRGYAPQRVQLLICHRRMLVFYTVFSAIFASTLLYTFSRPKVYEAEATAARFHLDAIFSPGSDPQISEAVYDRVAKRIPLRNSPPKEKPYDDSILNNHEALIRMLKENTSCVPVPGTINWGFRIRHPDPHWAAFIANVLVDECIVQDAVQRIDGAMAHVQEMEAERVAKKEKIQRLKTDLESLSDSVAVTSERKEIEDRIHAHETEHDELTKNMRNFIHAGQGLDMTSARFVEQATIPQKTNYVSPHLPRHIGLGFATALCLASGACLLVRRTDGNA